MPESNVPVPHPVIDAVEAHAAAAAAELDRLRALGMRERAAMLEAACLAAEELERSRLAAGMPPSQPAPWPASTWKFLKQQAARVRS